MKVGEKTINFLTTLVLVLVIHVANAQRQTSLGSIATFETERIGYQEFDYLDDTHVIAVYKADGQNAPTANGADLWAIVGTIDTTNKTISWGTRFQVETDLNVYPFVVAISSTQAVIGYEHNNGSGLNQGSAKVVNISGNSISSSGSRATFSLDDIYFPRGVHLGGGKVVFSYEHQDGTNTGDAVVGQVTGSSISFGSVSTFANTDIQWHDIEAVSTSQVLISYENTTGFDQGEIIVGSISGNSISFGTSVVFRALPSVNAVSYNSVAMLDAPYFVVAWTDDSQNDNGYARVGQLSGSTISFPGSIVGFETSSDADYVSVTQTNSDDFIISYAGPSAQPSYVVTGTRNGTGLLFGTRSQYHSGQANRNKILAPNENSFVVVFRDANGATGVDDQGKYVVGTMPPVPAPNTLAVVISNTINVDCNGASTGSLTATTTPGVANYSYFWSNGVVTSGTSSTTNTVTGLSAGLYTVTVTDANGGSVTASGTITNPSAINATISVSSNAECGNNGELVVNATGGTAPYNYIWNTGITNDTNGLLGAGIYTVTVTDNNSCQKTASASIINSGLSGTYTVGGTSPTFSTIQKAIDSLETEGVCGPVNIHIRQSTYVEQLILDSIPGVDSVNTITFMTDPSSSKNAIISNNSDFTIKFQNDVSYVTFKDLTIQTTGQANVIELDINNDHISFINDSLIGAIATIESNSLDVILDSGAITNTSNFTLDSNVIVNGSTSFQQTSASASNKERGFVITNNTILNFYRTGLHLKHSDDILVENNYIYTVSSAPLVYGLYGDINNEINVIGNKIFIDAGSQARPLMLWNPAGTNSKRIQISNNSTSMINTSNSNGHYNFIYSPRFCDIVFNSMYGHTNNTNEVLNLDARGSASTFQNNNIYNNGTGFAIKTLGTNITMDYNNVYGNSGASNLSGGTMGSNSISVNPNFISTTDLSPTNSALEGAGISFAGITSDINGNTRLNPPTIGASQVAQGPLSGTYTIGATNRDYANFTSAVHDLDSFGVNGPVIFNVDAGTYAEQIEIDSIWGANSTNTITFQMNPSIGLKPILEFSPSISKPAAVLIDGADYVSFKNLEVRTTSNSFGNAFRFEGYTQKISIDSCDLIGALSPLNNDIANVIHSSSLTGHASDSIAILNCTVKNGNKAISFTGMGGNPSRPEKGNRIINCSITNYTQSGIVMNVQSDMEISGNSLLGASSTSQQVGIDLNAITTNCNILSNSVLNNTSSISGGIYVYECKGTSSGKITIANNTYRNAQINNTNDIGLFLFRSNYVDSYFNTLIVRSSSTSGGRPIYINDGLFIVVKNNVFYNSGAGYAYTVQNNPSNYTSDYNNLYTQGSLIGNVFGADRSDFTAWKTGSGQDNNSYNINPNFLSDSVLIPNNGLLNNKGQTVSGITADISGVTRNIIEPDIGAFEFTGILPPMAGIYTIGGISPDYDSLTHAVAALHSRGISDTVLFHIREGVYNEQLRIDTISGSSENNWVRFTADPSNTAVVKLTHATSLASPYVILLYDADNIQFSDITIERTGTHMADHIVFELECSNVRFDSCTTIGSTFGSSLNADLFGDLSSDRAELNHLSIQNCTLNTGISLFPLDGADSVQIIGNTLLNGIISVRSLTDAIIQSNHVNGNVGFIFCTNITVDANYMNLLTVSNSSGWSVSNNQIIRSDNGGPALLVGASDGSVYNNTLKGNILSAKISGTNNSIKNNVFYSAGYAIEIDSNSTNTLDFNAYYSEIDTIAEYITSGFVTSLSEFQVYGSDTNSWVLNPRFTTDSVLIPGVVELQNAGSPITGITTDIQNSSRNSTNPSIGAYEYVYDCSTIGLSGVYTINPAGSGSRNYSSISAAVNDLNNLGICDDVTFNIRQGTYQEQILVEDIYNAGDSGWVTFRNDPNNTAQVIIKDTSRFEQPGIFVFHKSGFVKLIGLEFEDFGNSNSDALASHVRFEEECTNFVIDSCRFTPSTNNFGRAIGTRFPNEEKSGKYPSGFAFSLDNISVTNCLFKNSMGVFSVTGEGTTSDMVTAKVLNCTFDSSGTGDLNRCDTVIFTNNTITGLGSYFESQLDISNSKVVDITNNKFENTVHKIILSLTYMYLVPSNRPVNFSNNEIRITGAAFTGNRSLISLGSLSKNFNIHHNSVSYNTSSSSVPKCYLFAVSSNTDNINFSNNVLSTNSENCIPYNLVSGTNRTFSHNAIYTENDTLAIYDTAAATSIAQLQALGLGSNSLEVNPYFLSETSLKPYRAALNGGGIKIAGINTDIEGTTRTNPPDIGAYEFDPILFDAVIDSVRMDTACAGSRSLQAKIRNTSDSVITKAIINWSIQEEGTVTVLDTSTDHVLALGKGDEEWVTLAKLSLNGGVKQYIKVSADTLFGSLATDYLDNSPENNQLLDTLEIKNSPIPVITTFRACLEDTLVFIASGGDSYKWSAPTGITDTTDTLIVSAPSSTMNGSYTLTAFDTLGCSGTVIDSIVLNPVVLIGLPDSASICSSTDTTPPIIINSLYTYSWNIGESSPNITVDSTSNYIVTVTDQNGCVAEDAFKLTVFADPIVQFTSNIDTACAFGDTIVLNHAVPTGGVYSGPLVNTASGVLTPSASGNYPVNYTFTDSNGCSGSADTVVIINKNPVVNLTNISDLCRNGVVDTITENSPKSLVFGVFKSNSAGLIDNVNGYFDPKLALVGTHEISYTYTDTATGCFTTDTNDIVVKDTFGITFSTPVVYCENVGIVTLDDADTLPSNFSGSYVSGSAGLFGTNGFNPTLAGVGLHTLHYNVVDTNNCSSDTTRNVRVDSIPVISISDTFFCVNANPLTLSTGSELGGEYIGGRGVTSISGNYDPLLAGVGLDTVVFRFENTQGCADTVSEIYQVFAEPDVTFSLPSNNDERCIDAEPFNLTGNSPVSNIGVSQFSGPGLDISNKIFLASQAGVGSHIMKFEYTDQRGCSDSAFDTIIVHDLPIVALDSNFTGICENRIPFFFTGSPVGGAFTGVGIDSSGFFNSSLVGATSTNIISYTYTDSNSCTNLVRDTFSVDFITPITLALIPNNCVNIDTVTLSQGSINSGSGEYTYKSDSLGTLVSGLYRPSGVGTGLDNITYIYENLLGCKDSLSQKITIHDTVPLNYTIPATNNVVCENDPTFILNSVNPIGGVYTSLTGAALVGSKFDPSLANQGNNFIQYTYSDSNNCVSRKVDTILVNAITPVTHVADTFCLNEGNQVLAGGTFNSGVFRYTGAGMINDSTFAPSIAGLGTKNISYTYTNSAGCNSQIAAVYKVNPAPNVQFNALSSVCLNTDTLLIGGASTSGDVSYFTGNGILDSLTGQYLAANAAVGTDRILFIGLNSNTGCSDTVAQNLVINGLPNTQLSGLQDFCVSDGPLLLNQGTPVQGGNGTYSGLGIIGIQFYPALAGTGSHTLAYTFTDNNNCTVSDSDTIVVNGLPQMTATSLPPVCLNTGLINLNGAQPLGGYYKGVRVDSAASTFTPDTVGIWSIDYFYTDLNGCSNSVQQTQQVRALPITTLSFDPKFCNNDNAVTLSGGSPVGAGGIYTGFGVVGNLYDPKTVNDTSDTLVYIYTDVNGCVNSDSVVISFDTATFVQVLDLPEVCKGPETIDLSQYFSPNTGKYTGVNVFGSNFISNLLDTGVYAINYQYIDSNNCSSAIEDSIFIRPLPSFELSADTGICEGDEIELSATGNNSYNWSTGDYLASIEVQPIASKTYSVTATNGFNCSSEKSVNVTVFDQITVYTSAIKASCSTPTGSVFTSVTGGTRPYNYLWSTGQRTSSASQLFAGNYQVTVNDKNGCTQFGSVGVNAEGGPEISIVSQTNNTCPGESNGAIEVQISADTSYTLFWNTGATGTSLANLPNGLYELSVLGDDGCNSFKSIEITGPTSYMYSSTIELPDCDSSNGSIVLSVTNSLDSISFQWMGQPVGDTLRNVRAGFYTAIAQNSIGCIDSIEVVLNNSFAPRIKIDSIQFVDCGNSNGSISVSGIDSVKSYLWTTGDTTPIISNLAVGDYQVTATDTAGCETIEKYEIEPVLPIVPIICKVTADSILGKNVLIWDTTGIETDSIVVYRESGIINQYFALDSIGSSTTNKFIDEGLNNGSSIGTYTLTSIDSCGYESEAALEHKAILLNTKQTDSTIIELNWSNYQGYNYSDFYVYRYSTEYGVELLDSVSSFNTYVDFNVPSKSTKLHYFVGIKGQTVCNDSNITTISNISRDYGITILGTSQIEKSSLSFVVWPNPNSGEFNIKLAGFETGKGQIIVFDAAGKILYENELDSSLQGQTQSINLSDINSGLYYVQFVQNETVVTREIVINR